MENKHNQQSMYPQKRQGASGSNANDQNLSKQPNFIENRQIFLARYADDMYQPNNQTLAEMHANAGQIAQTFYPEDQSQRNDEESIVGTQSERQHPSSIAQNVRLIEMASSASTLIGQGNFQELCRPTGILSKRGAQFEVKLDILAKSPISESDDKVQFPSDGDYHSDQMMEANLQDQPVNNESRRSDLTHSSGNQRVLNRQVCLNPLTVSTSEDHFSSSHDHSQSKDVADLNLIEQLDQSRGSRNDGGGSPAKSNSENESSNLSSPMEKSSIDEKLNTTIDNIRKDSIDDDMSLLDEPKQVQNSPAKTSEAEMAIQKYLQEEHNVSMENLVMKLSPHYQKCIIKVISLKQLQLMRTALLQFRNSFQPNEEVAEKVDDLFGLINDTIEKKSMPYYEQKDDAEKMEMQDEPDSPITFDWSPDDKFRAKLYQLDNEGRWQDHGTGYFSIEYKGEGSYQMSLMQENDNSFDLLENELISGHSSITFSRQRDTIITWSDKDKDSDQAVSFQNNHGAQYTWQKICQIMKIDPNKQQSQEQSHQEEEDPFAVVNMQTIPKIAEEFRQRQNQTVNYPKQEIAERFLENECRNLSLLGELFVECETQHLNKVCERIDYLIYFFFIYKGLITLNDHRLLETLMSNTYYMQTFGALEWDPETLNEDADLYKSEQVELMEIENESPDKENAQPLASGGESVSMEQLTPVKDGSSVKGDQAPAAANKQQSLDDNVELEVGHNFPEKCHQLNYREFLSKIVKFKKVIDLTGACEEERKVENKSENSQTQGTGQGIAALEADCIEERIHINYRLQFLRDSVMARYIDDQSVNAVNQVIMQNNRQIIHYIFEEEDELGLECSSGAAKIRRKSIRKKSFKDQIIEKISNPNDMKTKHLAIEFMIELCQVLKSLSFSPGGLTGGNASNFIYGQNGNLNSRSIYDQLNQVGFIDILAETFSIFVPNEQTLIAHLNRDPTTYYKKLVSLYSSLHPNMDQQVISELIEIKRDRNVKDDEDVSEHFEETNRLDSMKMNSMEIILGFQQSTYVPIGNIINFVMGQEQQNNGYQLFSQLVAHLVYSPAQGLKLQIAEFFKQLLECDQNYMTLTNFHKETMYSEIITKFVDFLNEFSSKYDFNKVADKDSLEFKKMKSLEYSAYLILQILNKVVLEHKFPFRKYMNSLSIIMKVAKLVEANSKLINVEIVKFYKALIRSKDQIYIQYVMQKNQFYPINRIFETSFKEVNPPMILSCVRDLFELIFLQAKNNEFYNAKLSEYLMNTDKQSKAIIANPKYKEVFSKYEKMRTQEDEDDDFLDHSKYRNHSEGSLVGSPVSNGQSNNLAARHHLLDSRVAEALPIASSSSSSNNNKVANSTSTYLIGSFNNQEEGGGENQLDEDLELATFKIDQQKDGGLSPIGNHSSFFDEISGSTPVLSPAEFCSNKLEPQRASKSQSVEYPATGQSTTPLVKQEDKDFLNHLEEEIEQDKLKAAELSSSSQEHSGSQQFELKKSNITIRLEVESAEEEHNKLMYQKLMMSGGESAKQHSFSEWISSKKRQEEHSLSAGKAHILEKSAANGAQKSTGQRNNGGAQSDSAMFERLSSSSGGLLLEEDLAKDMGIFSFDSKKHLLASPKIEITARRNSLDELDIPSSSKTSQKKANFTATSIFTTSAVAASNKINSGSLSGIFNGVKNTNVKQIPVQKRSLSGDQPIETKKRKRSSSSNSDRTPDHENSLGDNLSSPHEESQLIEAKTTSKVGSKRPKNNTTNEVSPTSPNKKQRTGDI